MFNRLTLTSALLVVGAFLVGTIAYGYLPEQVATHWNLAGDADGYSSKFWGTFLFPVIMAVCYLLFLAIPKIDPKAKNIEMFRVYFDGFILVFMTFMFLLYGLTLGWNLGYQVPFNVIMPVLMGGLFFYIGVMVGHAEPNWTIGIRTPWTLSNDEVWRKTHRLGGKLFKAGGILAIISALVPQLSFFFVLGGAVGVSLFLFGYSFYLYKTS